MKICYITQCGFSRTSAESVHALEIVKAFSKLGHDILVVHTGKMSLQNYHINEVAVNLGDNIKGKLLFQLWLVYYFFIKNRTKYDLIYTRQSAVMLTPSFVSHLFNKKLFVEFNTLFAHKEVSENNLQRFFLFLIERYTVNVASRIIVVSGYLRNCLEKKYPDCISKIIEAENGANLELMKPCSQQRARGTLGLPDNSFIVGFVGHLHPWQGIECIIETLADLSHKYKEILLVVAGTGRDEAVYIEQASSLGIENHVLFLGGLPYKDISPVIAACDVCVAPGTSKKMFNYEIRSPLKVYEYLSCGRPVIAGYLDILEKYFHNNEIGFLIEPGDEDQLKNAIECLISNKETALRMGYNARVLAETSFSWEKTAMKILGQ